MSSDLSKKADKADTSVGSWLAIPLESGISAGVVEPQARLLPGGNVQLHGEIVRTNGADFATGRTVALRLPAAFTPKSRTSVVVEGAPSAAAVLGGAPPHGLVVLEVPITGICQVCPIGQSAKTITLSGIYYAGA